MAHLQKIPKTPFPNRGGWYRNSRTEVETLLRQRMRGLRSVSFQLPCEQSAFEDNRSACPGSEVQSRQRRLQRQASLLLLKQLLTSFMLDWGAQQQNSAAAGGAPARSLRERTNKPKDARAKRSAAAMRRNMAFMVRLLLGQHINGHQHKRYDLLKLCKQRKRNKQKSPLDAGPQEQVPQAACWGVDSCVREALRLHQRSSRSSGPLSEAALLLEICSLLQLARSSSEEIVRSSVTNFEFR